ncbi:MAG TPA: transporter substrate-binding domain-containing protein [Xanthobacteraceae bacterium]|nr:transporter substrate-binding domain-containing protein [Xanthobacteraceae bacterium]
MTLLERCAKVFAVLALSLAIWAGQAGIVLAAAATQQEWDDCASGDASRAIAACGRIIDNAEEPATSRADALIYRGGLYVAQGDLDRAIVDCGEAIRLAPQNVTAHASRALAYALKGDRARAVTDYVAAERLDPKAVAEMAAGSQEFAAIAAAARADPPPASVPPVGSASPTLSDVRRRGVLRCGVSIGIPGFSIPDPQGAWSGLDVDLCRGIAAAIFDDPARVKFLALPAAERFTALLAGDVDLLARNTARSAEREKLGVRFGATNFYDGTAFMVRRDLALKSPLELDGADVCVRAGNTSEQDVVRYFRAHKMKLARHPFASGEEQLKAFEEGRCNAIATDRSELYLFLSRMAAPNQYVILPGLISDEQLAPVVRAGDDEWLKLVTWTHYAMVAAEDLGVSQAVIRSARQLGNPAVGRLLGDNGPYGDVAGLGADWAARVIVHVGNYGEAFERNLGERSPFRMERGANALVANGGQQRAPAP